MMSRFPRPFVNRRAAGIPFVVLGWACALCAADGAKPADGSAAASEAVQCANLVYAGTRSSVCFSDAFLAAVAEDSTVNVARRFRSVKLSADELFAFPFAIMTGEGAFRLTGAERERLKKYLEGGGFLLASAGCSSQAWDAAFRKEIEAVFPDLKLTPLAKDHAVFKTVYDVPDLKTKGAEAKLLGLELNGKTVLVYSADGLNDSGAMPDCCCCGGNEITNARQVNANILAYALMQ